MLRLTAFQLNRVRSAVRSYNAAITRKARELASNGLDDLIDFLPPKTSVEAVKSRIRTKNDFRRIVGYANDKKRGRPSELDRVLKSVRPDALDFKEDERGNPITNYQDREMKTMRIAEERKRRKEAADLSTPLFDGDSTVDISSLTGSELLTAVDNTDLIPPDAGEVDDTVLDVDAATLARWQYEDLQRKRYEATPPEMAEIYLNTWKAPANMHSSLPNYQILIDAMEYLYTYRPDVLVKMFNMGHDELDPMYITDSGGTANPYINIDYEVRHNRAVSMVLSYAIGAGFNG